MAVSGVAKGAERWHTFARIVGWSGVARVIAKTALHSATFHVSKIGSRTSYQAFTACQTPEDYFDFASGQFPANQNKQEIVAFLSFAAADEPQNVCEIGTYYGGTTFLLSQALPSVNLMIGIDLYVRNSSQLHYFSRPNQKMDLINGSSCAPSITDKVSQTLGGRTLDVLFIDGDHEYEGVKQDFLTYRHFVRENGIIAFHDIVPDHQTRHGAKTGNWVGEVPRFWSKVKSLYPSHEFIADSDQDGRGIGAIRYSTATPLPIDL